MRAHRLPNPSTAFSCGNTRSSTAIHGIVLRDFERAAARIRLSAGSWVKNGPVTPRRCSMSARAVACMRLAVGPSTCLRCSCGWGRLPQRQRHRAAQKSFAGAILPRCCDDACTASSRGVSSIYQTQDQCPSLASARAVGGGTPLGLGGFHPPLDDSEGAWTHFKPSPPITHTLHHRIRSSLSELDYRDCRSAGASLGGAAMATTATMVSDVCALNSHPPARPAMPLRSPAHLFAHLIPTLAQVGRCARSTPTRLG